MLQFLSKQFYVLYCQEEFANIIVIFEFSVIEFVLLQSLVKK